MTFLILVFLVLADLLLLDVVARRFYGQFDEWRSVRRMIGGHPEMQGVDGVDHDLIVFKADEAIREMVMENDAPAGNEPFLGDLFLFDEEEF